MTSDNDEDEDEDDDQDQKAFHCERRKRRDSVPMKQRNRVCCTTTVLEKSCLPRNKLQKRLLFAPFQTTSDNHQPDTTTQTRRRPTAARPTHTRTLTLISFVTSPSSHLIPF